MSEENKGFLKQKWEKLSPQARRFIWVGTIVGLFVLAVYSFVSSDTPTKKRARLDRNDVSREVFTRAKSREVNLHGLASTVTSLEKKNQDLQNMVDQLKGQIRVTPEDRIKDREAMEEIQKQAAEAAVKALEEKFATKTAELEALLEKAGEATSAAPADGAPAASPGVSSPVAVSSSPEVEDEGPKEPAVVKDGMNPEELSWGPQKPAGAPPSGTGEKGQAKKAAPKLRHIVSQEAEAAAKAEKQTAEAKKKEPKEVFIPAGSIFSGTLMTGLDAPTGTAAKKSPFPSLLRIKKEAILPNRYRADVRECFLIASGYGDLSSERVYMRAETISCVRNDGGVIEAPIDMYAVGEDGKAGVRGKLDTKQGQYLAKAMAAGFLDSVASVFTSVPTATISTAADSVVPFQRVFSEESAQSAAIEGAGSAMERLANFYIEMAQSVFPIVQVDAGRQLEFVMTKGTSLKLR